VTARVLHLSDLHIGRNEAPEPISALRELAAALGAELVIATGDLAHRGKRSQLERAAEMLGSLGTPVLAVPGNHDTPFTHARFTGPFAGWERVFGETEPVYRSERIVVVGLNSVRPWRQQSGALDAAQLDRTADLLRTTPDGALRVVALHHHLAAPPWRARHKRPVSNRDAVLQALAAAGAELVASGHVHQAGIAERREFEVLEDPHARTLVLATTPGFGRPRPRRKGEARGVNVYDADAGSLTVTTYAWNGNTFAETARRVFPRG
jgi:3',5'-cyclic AMP phosphodiesterase CpdA